MAFAKKYGLYESSRISYLAVSEISPNPSQPRKQFEQESLRELADSIRRYGILQPLTVHRTGKNYELISGERRLRAAKLAGLTEVPCIVLDVKPTQTSVLALVENLHRQDLDFIEEAEGIYQLISLHGLTQEEAAQQLGRSQSAIANKLRILRLPGEILYILKDAGLTERHARALLRLESDDQRILALNVIIRKGYNVARTEEYIGWLLSKGEAEEKNNRPLYVLKDVRLFLNTVSRGMSMMKESGIHAECGKSETDTDIILTIKIPKGVSA